MFFLCRKDVRYSEKDAAKIVRQMLKVAACCHLNGIVHRDLKPEVRKTQSGFYVIIAEWFLVSSEVMFCITEFPFQIPIRRFLIEGHRFWAVRLHSTRQLPVFSNKL